MDKEKLDRWLSLIANFAVVAGILFLAVEIRQNNELLKAEARSNRTANMQQFNEMMIDASIASLVVKASDTNSFSPEETLRYKRLLRWVLVTWESEYLDYQSGLSDWIPTEGYKNTFQWLPGLREEWEEAKGRRNPDFVEFIEHSVLVE